MRSRTQARLAPAFRARQIARVPLTVPPYALSAPAFPLRHLAALAGRAPIGGAREVALACFVAARLAAEHAEAEDVRIAAPARIARAAGAKSWLATLALPTPMRAPLARCVEHSGDGPAATLARDVASLAALADSYLDAPARGELAALARRLQG